MTGDGVRGLVELPKGNGAAEDDGSPEDDEDGCGVPVGDFVPETQDVASVVDAKADGDGVAGGAADGEGGHELLLRHLERTGGENERRERHRRWEDGRQRDGEDGVALHPLADAAEDARGDASFEKGDAARLADLVAEISANGRAGSGDEDEDEPVTVAGGQDDEHDVGNAGDGEGNEGRIDNGDEEESQKSEAEEKVHQSGLVTRAVLRKDSGSCGCVIGHDGNCCRQSHAA